ncbi:MAG: acyltransferase [Flavobacteriales bacterium]|nr:acyltransferase [Flavobacteriales bacterium]
MAEQKKKSVYFPGLNGLRFFAAFAVVITHIELMKKYMRNLHPFDHGWLDIWGKWVSGPKEGEPVVTSIPLEAVINDPVVEWYHPIIPELGPLGVVFFFVLSGFLITYLLFAERDATGTVAIKDFYMRRIFRIWPLYYLIFILGFLVLPQSGPNDHFFVPYQSPAFDGGTSYWASLIFYGLFFPNIAYSIFGAFPNIGQSWSIGVEEQFYLIWPWLMRKTKKPLRVIITFFMMYLMIKVMVIVIGSVTDINGWQYVRKFFAMSKLECMAFGGVGAWYLYNEKDRLLNFIFSKPVQILSFLGIPFLMYFTPAAVQNVVHLAYSVLFLIIIMNVSSNPNSILRLERKWLSTLGKISYGIYMFHMLIIVGVLHLFMMFLPPGEAPSFLINVAIYVVSIGLTLLVSYLSYHYFENRFIRMKRKFTKVVSGDEAKKA